MEQVTLTIDGREVTADAGGNVLDAALRNDIYIPHLCHHPDLEPAGVCRLCMVDVEGVGMVASCRLPASEGLVVRTESPLVDQTRRVALELQLINHPLDCLTCARNNDCKLQEVAAYIGVDQERMQRMRRRTETRPVDGSNPFSISMM